MRGDRFWCVVGFSLWLGLPGCGDDDATGSTGGADNGAAFDGSSADIGVGHPDANGDAATDVDSVNTDGGAEDDATSFDAAGPDGIDDDVPNETADMGGAELGLGADVGEGDPTAD